jgi:hypothetical protein
MDLFVSLLKVLKNQNLSAVDYFQGTTLQLKYDQLGSTFSLIQTMLKQNSFRFLQLACILDDVIIGNVESHLNRTDMIMTLFAKTSRNSPSSLGFVSSKNDIYRGKKTSNPLLIKGILISPPRVLQERRKVVKQFYPFWLELSLTIPFSDFQFYVLELMTESKSISIMHIVDFVVFELLRVGKLYCQFILGNLLDSIVSKKGYCKEDKLFSIYFKVLEDISTDMPATDYKTFSLRLLDVIQKQLAKEKMTALQHLLFQFWADTFEICLLQNSSLFWSNAASNLFTHCPSFFPFVRLHYQKPSIMACMGSYCGSFFLQPTLLDTLPENQTQWDIFLRFITLTSPLRSIQLITEYILQHYIEYKDLEKLIKVGFLLPFLLN